MGSKKGSLQRVIPSHSWIPLLLVLLVGVLTYYGTRFLNTGRVHHTVAIALDDAIPFVPFFIYFYILAFAQWGLGFITVLRSPEETTYYYVSSYFYVSLIATICFLLYPTAIERPEVTGSGLTNDLVRMIYQADLAGDNLLPSLHCADCWLSLRVTLSNEKSPKWLKIGDFIFVLGVFASVVLVKQHYVVDIPTGFLLAELGLWLARVTPLPRLLGGINAKLRKKGWLPA